MARNELDPKTIAPELLPIARALENNPTDREGWDMAVSLCSEAIEAKDAAYWTIGDTAHLIASQGKYGQNALGQFADEIDERVERVRELRTVARFWNFQRRQKFLDTPLKYSHFRTAMRLKQDAEGFLEACLENNWKVKAAYVQMRKLRGEHVPPITLLDAEGAIERYDALSCTLTLELAGGVNWWPIEDAMRKRRIIQVVIREVQE